MENISDKLFDLACNQLLLKKLRSEAIASIKSPDKTPNFRGVFIYDRSNLDEWMVLSPQLMFELLLLPNQYHCFFALCGNRGIWILNNNGSEYKKSDIHFWEKLNLVKLINCLLSSAMFESINIKNYIEYCVKNNQFIFLKKMFYFLKQIRNVDPNTWPQYREEYIIMMVKKYNRTLGNNKYFVDQIRQIFKTTLETSITPKNFMSIFSSNVEQYVKNIGKTTLNKHERKITNEKNIQFLKKQSHWQCFLCKNINVITQNICPYCFNNKFLYTLPITHTHPQDPLYGKTTYEKQSIPAINCLNPYQPFIASDSTLFNIEKSFGIIEHMPLRVMDPNTKNTKYCKTNRFVDFKYQPKDGRIIGVTYEVTGFKRVSILFNANNSLTIGELKIIMYELYSMWMGSGQYRELLHCTLESHPVFGTMSDGTPIPKNINGDYYFVKWKHFIPVTRIKSKFVIKFGQKHCNYQCPFMISKNQKLMKQNNNKNSENNKDVKFSADLNPYKHCRYFNGEYNFDNTNNIDKILDHLSSFDHFKSFEIVQERCPFKSNVDCPHYQRVIQAEKDTKYYDDYTERSRQNRLNFDDKKHLYLYCHSPTEKDINNINNDTMMMVDNSKRGYEWYDYVPQKLTRDTINMQRTQTYSNSISGPGVFIPKLITEVVRNNFIEDLLPRPADISKKDVLNKLEPMINAYINHFDNINAMRQLEIEFTEYLSNTFGIFEILNKKFNHPRHKRMGYPLQRWHMLSIILYCIDHCNHDLTSSQRDGSYQTKWPVFDCLLNFAIEILSQFEQHWENIYTGICGAFYKFQNKNMRDIVYLTTNVSFTSDLNVAKQFRSAAGMIIGLNMKRSYAAITGKFCACDVSWISKHPWEKEVLCKRGSQICFYPNKMRQILTKENNQQQCFVCDDGNLQETSYPAMFL